MLSRLTAPSSAARQTGVLVGVDSASHAIDYGFHVYLGRALPLGDFGIVQTLNAIFLILFTTFSVLQPVVARFVAESEALEAPPGANRLSRFSRAVFQRSFGGSLILGLALVAGAMALWQPIGSWLRVPPSAVLLFSLAVLLSMPRLVVAGVLQGLQRFAAYGFTRAMFSLGRLLSAVLLIGGGAGVLGGVAAYPIGALSALVGGLAMLGYEAWRPAATLPPETLRRGLNLSLSAFVAYAAHMSLLNNDLIWVQRGFAPDVVGEYATAVLFRRAVTILTAAAVVILFPKVVRMVAQGRPPDRLLGAVFGFVLASTLAFTAVFFVSGEFLVGVAFGERYRAAGQLLGWMGVAMAGYNLAAVWLNVFLGTRPGPYVVALTVAAAVQIGLLAQPRTDVIEVIAIFGAAGWALALLGLPLYLFWLRPQIGRISVDERFVL